ncbi:MAG: orotate phosphoribosyltransferase [Candidatus Scalindua sp.]|nr:orotate phosphoribosyltransferase [Candidatus Scalindua sp.]MBT5305764.1 orotate phosphoribosyltransferase [Candidatus Scalindua sp.]MBT6053690.1 orotate phosphoribosyltransferase [Candidatus Scalindua sp.]MBT6561081.1 orotate phosphoribosyltransferase [Candidatus Scalindua sp.]MBT7212161.1 orotate phosphoribosyltransferase [Candidatus Scalindua sp.]
MIMNEQIAKVLLEKRAVTLNAKDPFTYVSGIRSPIYCDNRQMIAYPEEREQIIDAFINKSQDYEFDIVAGTSTAGIPWASWISDKLNKPMAYIRGAKKGHGAGNQIEGANVNGEKVLIVEDLISTGGSSFSAVEAVREAGGSCVAVVAIFTYDFKKAGQVFKKGGCKLLTITNFSTLVNVAKNDGILTDRELSLVLSWNKDPQNWGPKHGFPNADKG